MPWQTLDLDPNTATAKDVKRAYAKRLKNCRPDIDPEGFRELHEAYTRALNELQWRENPVKLAPTKELGLIDEVSVPSVVGAAVIETPPLSAGLTAVAEVLDRLELALKEGREGVAALVREAEDIAESHPEEIQRWGEIMHDLIRDHGTHDDIRLKPEAMLFEIEQNSVVATIAVIDRLDRQGQPRPISGLSKLFNEKRKRIATPAGGIAAARLAGVAAFWAPGHVEMLSNFAYENLARGERDFHMEMIDNHADMRGFLSMVPERLKSFFRQRLMNIGGIEVWDTEDAVAALRWLKTPLARRGPVHDVMMKLIPNEVAAAANMAIDLGVRDTTTSTHATPPKWSREPPVGAQWRSRSTPGGELDWNIDDELAPTTKSRPQRVSKSGDELDLDQGNSDSGSKSSHKPSATTEAEAEPSMPKSRSAPVQENWLDLENQASTRPVRRAPQSNSRRGASIRAGCLAIFVISIILKIVLTFIAMAMDR